MSCVLWWGVWCLPWNKSTLYPGCTQATQISTNGAQAGEQINKFKYFLFKFDYVRSIPTSARQTIGTFYFFISIFPYKLFRGGEPFFTGITQIRLFITKIIETKKHENALYYFLLWIWFSWLRKKMWWHLSDGGDWDTGVAHSRKFKQRRIVKLTEVKNLNYVTF